MKSKYKNQLILIISILAYCNSFSQQFPHVASSNNSAERVSSFRVNDSSTELLEITNSTNLTGQFIPSIWAHHQADNRYIMRHFVTTNSTQDNGSTPMHIFRAEIRNNLNLGAPNAAGVFPWGSSRQNVSNRPLFAWENGDTQLMRILANGFIGINTISPTASLDVNGKLRVRDITDSNTDDFILTTDENGNVNKQLKSEISSTDADWLTVSNSDIPMSINDNIYSLGRVGINTTSPSSNLHVDGTVRFENLPNGKKLFRLLGTDIAGNVRLYDTNQFGANNNCNLTNHLVKSTGFGGSICSQIFDNGTNVGIGTTTPSNKLTVNGNIQSLSNTFLSDQKFKKNINKIENALENVLNLSGTTYDWRRQEYNEIEFSEKKQFGLIAQDVQKIFPELVDVSEDGDHSLNYIGLIPILIEAIKDQQNQIIALQNQINSNHLKSNNAQSFYNNTKIIRVSPNPSSDIVEVLMNIEKDIDDAKLIVYDLKGSIITHLFIRERGEEISKYLQKDNLGSGTYIISLIANGKSIDSQKLIFK